LFDHGINQIFTNILGIRFLRTRVDKKFAIQELGFQMDESAAGGLSRDVGHQYSFRQPMPCHRFSSISTGSISRGAGFLLALLFSNMAAADYVGTAVNRILLDPTSLSVVVDGFQVNDEVSYVLETTPSDTGSTVGTGAWATAYMPNGVVVVSAELVIPSGGGYIKIPAKDVGPMAEDCGARGCNNWTEIAGSFEDAPLGPGQQDTGIFYSTDARTVQLASPLAGTPSGSGTQSIWNQWDFDQIVAFGMKKNVDAAWPLLNPGIDGKGNTALVSSDGGTSWKGTGSPVAGPDTFYTNDYDPDCNTVSASLVDDTQCVGPWQRIKYDNAKISGLAGGAALTPASTATSVLVNNSVLTGAGHDFTVDGALPANTNAVRFVQGIRRLGDIEYARVTFKIVDAAAFAQSVFVDRDFCLDGTGSDTDKPARGAQDNIFRYYEGNPHSCYTGSSDANFAKLGRFVNGVPSVGANLAPEDIISYELVFTNTSVDTLYGITFTDTATLNLDLIAEGDPDCAYASYDSVPAGAAFDGSSLPGSASWNAFPSLDAGESVSVFVCAQAGAGVALGDQVKNTSDASYKLTALGSPEPALLSDTLGTVSSQLSGAVYSDRDSSGALSAGDTGLAGVTVELWDDSTGSVDGQLDAGDTLLRSGLTAPDGSYEFNGFFGDLIVVATDLSGYSSTGDTDNGAVCATGNGCNVIGSVVLENDEKSVNNNFFDYTPPISDLSLVNTVDNPTALVGFTVTFTLVLSNDGPDTATNIDVADVLPDGFTFLPGSMTGGDSRDPGSASTLVWGVDTLASGASTTLSFQATVNASGNYVNTAQVAASDQGDSDSTDNNDDGDQSEDDEDSAMVTPTAPPPPTSITITANPVCVNDTPYLDYNVTPVGFTPDNLATIEWIGSDNVVVETLSNQPLTGGRLLWPGAAVDGDGNPTAWPGWDFVDGSWVAVPTTVRPGATVRISVNPTSSVMVAYPPATAACNANPPAPVESADGNAAPSAPSQPVRAVPTMPVYMMVFLVLGIALTARRKLCREQGSPELESSGYCQVKWPKLI
jgi:uncharacterized repeat protein (TIGR01451 family)